MTFIEKNTVLAALCEYEKAERRKAESQRKRGQYGKAAEHEGAANIAAAMKFTWAEILTKPAGTVKI